MNRFEIYTLSSAYSDGHDFEAGFNMTSGDFLERTSYAERLGAISTDALFNGTNYEDLSKEQEERLGKYGWIDSDKYTMGICQVYNIENEEFSINEIKDYLSEEKLFGVMFSIDEYESEDDFVMEIREWIKESEKIQEYGGDNEEWIYNNLPMKDFKFKYFENEGLKYVGEFNSCLYETIEEGKIFMLVPNGKIEEIQ